MGNSSREKKSRALLPLLDVCGTWDVSALYSDSRREFARETTASNEFDQNWANTHATFLNNVIVDESHSIVSSRKTRILVHFVRKSKETKDTLFLPHHHQRTRATDENSDGTYGRCETKRTVSFRATDEVWIEEKFTLMVG